MPSSCCVESCKLVKQVGANTSFHKFPNPTSLVYRKWVEFLQSKDGVRKERKITKYSSICSRHFLQTDFSDSQGRKFLRKGAIPSVGRNAACQYQESKQQTISTTLEDDEPVEVGIEDPLGEDSCNLCRSSSGTSFHLIDEYCLGLIRKCLPFTINLNSVQKLCEECIKNLNNFSSFIDKILSTQNSEAANFAETEPIITRNIKVEPATNFENEVKIPSKIHVIDFTQRPNAMLPLNSFVNQKKCEILEIVDIKPLMSFNFDGTLQECYDEEDDIQILSPKQLKVELTDPDEDGSNELELIRNYMFVSTVFLQDHNYVKNDQISEQNVKTENDDEACEPPPSKANKICTICDKSFKSTRKYLLHKISTHSKMNFYKKRNVQGSKITKQKQHYVIPLKTPKKKIVRNKKTYECPTCSKIFSGSKNLYQHKISHTDSLHSCTICDKKFKRTHGLKQHIKAIHEQNKSHVCPICKNRYLLKADMIRCKHSKLKKSPVEIQVTAT